MTKSFVVDASFVFKLIIPNPQQIHCRTLVTQWQQEGCTLYAPALWLYEITSALCKMVHFGELTPAEAQRLLALVHKLSVQTIPPDETQTHRAFAWTHRLNRVAAYDSFYLALAETLNCELWTADQRLRNAVNLPWVHGLNNN
ncbi:MAG: type II toxin-antitoxin system VapC family toxin [Anaerolineae bacterium]|nr:type II toxin-antitoxin system VapC family toxin [Anaerolineae bacterium]